METFTLKISLPSDEEGYTGRECPNCNEYFKVKYKDELKAHKFNCPYCSYEDDYDNFKTEAQQKYIDSIIESEVHNRFIKPMLDKLDDSLKELERKTKGGLIQIKVRSSNSSKTIPINNYQEKQLETDLTCGNCGLEFSVYGVFTTCPDCKELSAITVFKKSLDSVRKRIELSNAIEDNDMKEALLVDSLFGCVSSFDGLGKALQKKYNTKLSNKRNLFQKIEILSIELKDSIGINIQQMIGNSEYEFLFEMFQARHLYEHNFGEIDEDFIKNVPKYKDQFKRKYHLDYDKLIRCVELVKVLGEKIFEELKK